VAVQVYLDEHLLSIKGNPKGRKPEL